MHLDAAMLHAAIDSRLGRVILESCRILSLRIYSFGGGGEMNKEELISILKRLLGEEDIDFLRKLNEGELMKLVMFIREKIGSPKGMH